MVSKFQWTTFWLATQWDPQNDWTATQNRVNYDVFAQAPLLKENDICLIDSVGAVKLFTRLTELIPTTLARAVAIFACAKTAPNITEYRDTAALTAVFSVCECIACQVTFERWHHWSLFPSLIIPAWKCAETHFICNGSATVSKLKFQVRFPAVALAIDHLHNHCLG